MNVEALLEAVANRLARRSTRRAAAGTYEIEAAVSIVLRPERGDLEFLAIKRAEHHRDPWSGHMALPGGRREPGDENLWGTAVRETWEEVGLDLARMGRQLGRLDDVAPVSEQLPAIAITPFVVAVPADLDAHAGPEVERSLWIPADALFREDHRGTLVLEEVREQEFPTVEYEGDVIWGLTLKILTQLAEVLEAAGYERT